MLVAFACAACDAAPSDISVPPGYSDTYRQTIAAAEQEGRLVIWSTTDSAQVRDLLDGFRKRYPRVTVAYAEMGSNDIYDRFLRDVRGGRPTADLLWSSAMDLQIKLVNDGYAQSYSSPESRALPDWANWKNEAWGITAEPIVMIYNRRLIDVATAPKSHVDIRRELEAPDGRFTGRIAAYDPARSGMGYLTLSQDDIATRDLWRTVRALGANQVRLYATTDDIIDDVSSGRAAIGYNVVGSYAADAMQRNADIAVMLPRDYTLVMSRIAMIPEQAANPNAARLFLDYMLSRDGQRALVEHSMPSVRSDLPVPGALKAETGSFRAIRVGPALLVLQDDLTRRHFMRRWDRALADGRSVGPD